MRITCLAIWLSFHFTLFSQQTFLAVGTYDSPGVNGILVYRFNSLNGELTLASKYKVSNPSFLTFSHDRQYLFAVEESAPADGKGGVVRSFRFSPQTGELTLLSEQRTMGNHPCHVITDQDDHFLFVANYSGGSLAMFPVHDGIIGDIQLFRHEGSGPVIARQQSSHVHGNSVDPRNHYVMTTDLGTDNIYSYRIGKKPALKYRRSTVPGAGPRLSVFHPTKPLLYCIEELGGFVTRYQFHKGRLTMLQRVSTKNPGDTSFAGSADIHISNDGRFLYASNRGNQNNIAVFSLDEHGRMTLVGHQDVMGKTPRNFSIDPSGKFLLVANQNSNEIVIFQRDVVTGLLKDSGKRIDIGKPVCLAWWE